MGGGPPRSRIELSDTRIAEATCAEPITRSGADHSAALKPGVPQPWLDSPPRSREKRHGDHTPGRLPSAEGAGPIDQGTEVHREIIRRQRVRTKLDAPVAVNRRKKMSRPERKPSSTGSLCVREEPRCAPRKPGVALSQSHPPVARSGARPRSAFNSSVRGRYWQVSASAVHIPRDGPGDGSAGGEDRPKAMKLRRLGNSQSPSGRGKRIP